MSVPLAFAWRRMLFANWPVDPGVVDRRLPEALSVQTYEDDAWLSVLPFVNADTRIRGLPSSLGVDVPELNVRTYVTCDGEPGIYFFSLDMASIAGVVGARLTHHLPYYYARMSVDVDGEEDGDGNRDSNGNGDGEGTDERLSFSSRRLHPGDRPARFEASYGPIGPRFEAEPGSLAEFLTERRRLFTQGTDGTVRYTEVDHERWPLHEAEATISTNTLFEANGLEHPASESTLYYSPGVSVTTTRSRRWRG